MALRMRRRRKHRLEQDAAALGKAAASAVEGAAREGLKSATEATAHVIESIGGLEGITGPTSKPRRARRVGIVLLSVLVLAAVGAALYAWWNRSRGDEEFARLPHVPNGGNLHPNDPTPPAPAEPEGEDDEVRTAAYAPTSMPTPVSAGVGSSEPPAQPWRPSTPAPASAPESESGHGPRPAWNQQSRDVPLFVLPLRPSVPFRGVAAPVAGRTQLPGSGPHFSH